MVFFGGVLWCSLVLFGVLWCFWCSLMFFGVRCLNAFNVQFPSNLSFIMIVHSAPRRLSISDMLLDFEG